MKVSTEAMVDSRFPVDGNILFAMRSGWSNADGSTEEVFAEEAASLSVYDLATGGDFMRPFVGE